MNVGRGSGESGKKRKMRRERERRELLVRARKEREEGLKEREGEEMPCTFRDNPCEVIICVCMCVHIIVWVQISCRYFRYHSIQIYDLNIINYEHVIMNVKNNSTE